MLARRLGVFSTTLSTSVSRAACGLRKPNSNWDIYRRAVSPKLLSTPTQRMPLITISAALTEGFKKHEVVPDVIDEFDPNTLLEITYGGENVVAVGNTLAVADTQHKPSIHASFPKDTEGTYTLVLTDPDAPSRTDNKWSEYCHYIVTGLKPGVVAEAEGAAVELDLSKGKELIPYMGPGPPPKTGKHRYVFVLYKEGAKSPEAPADRPTWGTNVPGSGTREWAKKNDLTLVTSNFFFAQNTEQ
ncbi:phosphatidylethanolamine-binding protein [Yarrowia lipolytica]|nr:hypothetical protein YALI1_B04853g [Yarrowia lipolytica]KAB8285276.1 phosphatidylethanolamine-binding protein [Yarrowia lipolytica]KAE8174900.1 phosphatidylethanolamine-binding protein [Yarrowia lipolytica]RDW27056.1 phosphatidylethanolamine-binding protein [Yarrowia lipolytica]RDW34538.1 phosphatidylethanolamine-binding protein [Yarrowia lipolytica]